VLLCFLALPTRWFPLVLQGALLHACRLRSFASQLQTLEKNKCFPSRYSEDVARVSGLFNVIGLGHDSAELKVVRHIVVRPPHT
jgi:hypothetical protein